MTRHLHHASKKGYQNIIANNPNTDILWIVLDVLEIYVVNYYMKTVTKGKFRIIDLDYHWKPW